MTDTISVEAIPDGGPTIAGRPVIGVEVDLADRMRGAFDGIDLLGIATKLAELPWTDGADEGHPPETMWWTVVNVIDPAGVTNVHIQAEPGGTGVVVYLPEIEGY
jgi:hypothetical protein